MAVEIGSRSNRACHLATDNPEQFVLFERRRSDLAYSEDFLSLATFAVAKLDFLCGLGSLLPTTVVSNIRS